MRGRGCEELLGFFLFVSREMLERGERERLHSQQGELERANVQYRARMKDLRARLLAYTLSAVDSSSYVAYCAVFRYEDFARGIGRELPADLGNKQFLHHPGERCSYSSSLRAWPARLTRSDDML